MPSSFFSQVVSVAWFRSCFRLPQRHVEFLANDFGHGEVNVLSCGVQEAPSAPARWASGRGGGKEPCSIQGLPPPSEGWSTPF